MKRSASKKGLPNPVKNASLLSRCTWYWLNPLLDKGSVTPLEESDLFDVTDDLQTAQVGKEFEAVWKEELKKPTPSLQSAVFAFSGITFYLGGIAKFFSDASSLVAPILLEMLIVFVAQSHSASPPPVWKGYVLAVGICLLALSQSFLNQFGFHVMTLLGVKLKTSMITSVYRKTLRLSSSARQQQSTGQIVNMMSTDTARLEMAAPFVHATWTAVIQVIVIVALLIRALGPSALAGIGVVVLITPIQGKVLRKSQELRRDTAQFTDQRVKLMNEILQGIKVLKVYAWEDPYMARIHELRVSEMNLVKTSAYLRAVSSSLMMVGPTLMSLAAFLVLGASGATMGPEKIFSALVYFNLLRLPLMMLPMSLGMLIDCKVALQRIQKFLTAEEIANLPERIKDDEAAIRIENARFTWELQDSKSEKKDGGNGGSGGPPKGPPATPTTVSSPTAKDKDSDEKKEKPEVGALEDINLVIPRGKLVAIVGAVGSGKSSLLCGLLGEMTRTSGRVTISGSLGYCSQQPWIQNATLRDNVLFGLPFDQQKYDAAIKTSALKRDLKVLPDGDQTEIGEKGINLSGGQKSRVNLARAVYFDADIVLLDDPLSAVDSHVSKYLFYECIKGAFAQKTRVLVTHQLQYLPDVDYVVCLKDGRIAEQGAYQELMDKNGEFAALMRAFGGAKEEEEEAGAEAEGEEKKKEEEHPEAAADTEKDKKDAKGAPKALMTKEERSTGSISWTIYLYYVAAFGSWVYAFVVLFFLVVSQSSKAVMDYWLALWSDNTLNQGLFFYLGIYAAIGGGSMIATVIATVVLAAAGYNAALVLHDRAFATVLRAPMSFFDTTPIGRILNRFSRDQDTIDSSIADVIRMTLTMFCVAFFTLAMIAVVSPWFLIPLLLVSIVYFRTQSFYRDASRELKRLESISRSPLFAHFSETLAGLPTIRAYGEEHKFILTNEERLDLNNRAVYNQYNSQRWLAIRLESIGASITLTACIISVALRDTLNPGLVGLSISYAMSVTGLLTWLIRQSVELENAMNSVERTKFYTDQLPQERPAVIQDCRPPANWPSEGLIKINELCMRYRPELPLVLKGISITTRAAEKIGVVGRTGAGKSSLMSALFRLIEPASGSLEIDGLDISRIGLTDLRSKLAIIPQDPVLYSGTLRANLDPFGQHRDEEVWWALEKSFLKEAISRLPEGLNAPVAENGDNFSVGQRCQICLARALLRKSKILVLDEATASIDMETDAAIQRTIRTEFQNCTILTIAHRLNTIIDYDRVLVLNFGEVAEFDTPGRLLSNPESMFSSMVNETGPQNAALLRSLALEADRAHGVAHGEMATVEI
eukprot:TRINITY_DN416_c0_g1_i6.p1 TRINITY_DN416_c0_g1~~TRINITY_DN416_c0_g1_i6.p1  ORF type:complete len:1330 (+),score=511.36 TRINITY_DN416_c0_g1_i6:191-4180(+)